MIKPKYEDAYSFSHGLAPVYENGLWGFINTDGEWAIKPEFSDARTLNDKGCGFVKTVENETWSLIKFVEFNYD